MHFLYPADMLTPRLPDEHFRAEADTMASAGHHVSLVDSVTLQIKASAFTAPDAAEAGVVYRGWMLTPTEYAALSASLAQRGTRLRTTPEQYLATHYLPNWYSRLADLTPETVVRDPSSPDLVAALTRLGWERFFVKDYVKSLKTAGGSVIDRPDEIGRVMAEMEKFRGTIEGGLCVRRFEDFASNSEVRYFAIDGECYGPDAGATIPPLVRECAARLSSPFFSVDIALRTDGTPRVVEVGDGQVSDWVGWTVDRFVSLWRGK